MQFMVNVNKLSKFFVFFLIFLYIVYLAYDLKIHKKYGYRKTFEIHNENLKNNNKTITGVILGGSNAMWGLSAKILSKKTNFNYYNLSFVHEGHNNLSYNKFITEMSNDYLEKDKIQQVIYSSIAPLHENIFKNHVENKTITNVWGLKSESAKPFVSYYRYIFKKYYLKQKNVPRTRFVSKNGDLEFFNVACPAKQHAYHSSMVDAKQAADFLNQKANFLSQTYPNAQITMLIPSEYIYLARYPRGWVNEVIQEFQKSAQKSQRIIAEPQLPQFDFLCFDYHHPTEKGREWRTNQLIQSLQSKEAISF